MGPRSTRFADAAGSACLKSPTPGALRSPTTCRKGIMRVNVKKWGNSASVRIPSAVMDAAQVRIDDTVDVRAEDGKIVIEIVRETDYDLDQLLDRITPENLHESIDFGGPVGKEAL